MIRSAFCGVTPGKPCKSAFGALFRFTDSFRLSPSLTPSAIAFVSLLRVAVVSAVFSFNWSELLVGSASRTSCESHTECHQAGVKLERHATLMRLAGPRLALFVLEFCSHLQF